MCLGQVQVTVVSKSYDQQQRFRYYLDIDRVNKFNGNLLNLLLEFGSDLCISSDLLLPLLFLFYRINILLIILLLRLFFVICNLILCLLRVCSLVLFSSHVDFWSGRCSGLLQDRLLGSRAYLVLLRFFSGRRYLILVLFDKVLKGIKHLQLDSPNCGVCNSFPTQ